MPGAVVAAASALTPPTDTAAAAAAVAVDAPQPPQGAVAPGDAASCGASAHCTEGMSSLRRRVGVTLRIA